MKFIGDLIGNFIAFVVVVVIILSASRGCNSDAAAKRDAKDREYLDRICGYPNCGVPK